MEVRAARAAKAAKEKKEEVAKGAKGGKEHAKGVGKGKVSKIIKKKDNDKKPKASTDGSPVHYMDGVIYSNNGKQVYRVFLNRSSTKEVRVSWGKKCSKAQAWEKALALFD